jgi:PPOX class probable FMN-dependent enzyme
MTRFTQRVRSEDELRALFPPPPPRAVAKQIDRLDDHCRAFIAHAPFVAIGTTNVDGTSDVSPKGGPPGFVRVLDDHRLALGELPGNNRLDGYTNLLANPAVGLLFLVPGVGETLRVNGRGHVVTDPDVLDACALGGRRPKIALGVEVVEAFIHCAKALRRSGLWDPGAWPDLAELPSPACMLVAHAGIPDDPGGARTAAALERVYASTLWNPGD